MTWGFEDAVMHHSAASGADKLLLLCVAKHETEEYGAFPSVPTLARYVNTGERAVQRTLIRLVAAGELTAQERPGRTTIYRTTAKCPPNCGGAPLHKDRETGKKVYAPTPVVGDGGVVHDGTSSATSNPRRARRTNMEVNTKIPLTPTSGGTSRPHCPRHRRCRADCAECQLLANPPREVAPWCGKCDSPETRMVLDDDRRPISRCPACHPSSYGNL